MNEESDRRVHAETQWLEIVRYNRRGQWYIESKENENRRRVDVAEAVEIERYPGVVVHFGVPGGSTFDRKVRGGATA
jgi:hypothetical protein